MRRRDRVDVASALAAAAELPDGDVDTRPEVMPTVLGGPEAHAHTESLSIDNRGGVYGQPLVSSLGDRLCQTTPETDPLATSRIDPPPGVHSAATVGPRDRTRSSFPTVARSIQPRSLEKPLIASSGG